MSTPITIYPNPPILAGFPTAADPPLAGPMPADLDDAYVAATVREGGFLTAPRSSYSTAPKTGTASSTIGLVITLHYGGSIYEVVYQLGAFTPLYLVGSTVNLGTGAYSLVRAGGFPPGVTVDAIGCVPCPPCPPIPSGGQTWNNLYAVDLTAQGNQALAAAGSYTIDGKTWWMKGTLWGTGFCDLVSGSGLRLFAPATLAGGSQPDRPNFRTVMTGITQRIVFFPFSQFTDYNPNAPVYVQWQMSGTISGNNDRCYSAGMLAAAASLAPMTNGERALCMQVCHHTPANANPLYWGPAGSTAPISVLNANTSLAAYRTGVTRFAKDRFLLVHALTASDLTPESPMDLSGDLPATQVTGQSNFLLGFYFTLHKAFSDGQTLDIYLTRLVVSQPKIP